MKFLVLALCVCAASAANLKVYPGVFAQASVGSVPVVPVAVAKSVSNYGGKDAEAAVLRSESEVNADGFNYVYETANGISAQASGIVKRVGDIDVVTSQGAYKYIASDGTPVEVSYVADENGYQPQSNLLPVAPPVPEAILRSLEYIASHPAAVEKKY